MLRETKQKKLKIENYFLHRRNDLKNDQEIRFPDFNQLKKIYLSTLSSFVHLFLMLSLYPLSFVHLFSYCILHRCDHHCPYFCFNCGSWGHLSKIVQWHAGFFHTRHVGFTQSLLIKLLFLPQLVKLLTSEAHLLRPGWRLEDGRLAQVW